MGKKNTIDSMLSSSNTVLKPERPNNLIAIIGGGLAGIAGCALVLFLAYPSLMPQNDQAALPNTTPQTQLPPTQEIQKTPITDAVARAQNSIVHFYRSTKSTTLAPEDRVAVGVAMTSDGWIAVGEDAIPQNAAELIAVARGTESSIEKKITDPFSHITFVKIKREDLQVVPFADNVLPTGLSITEITKNGTLNFGFVTSGRTHVSTVPTNSETLDVSLDTTTPRAVGSILFAADGSLIGIVGDKDITTSSTIIRDATKLLLKKGAFVRPKLGLTAVHLSALVVRNKAYPSNGALITKKGSAAAITKKSAADNAGLKEGDVITKVDSIEINSDHTLAEALSLYAPGTTVPLTVSRGGATVQIVVSL